MSTPRKDVYVGWVFFFFLILCSLFVLSLFPSAISVCGRGINSIAATITKKRPVVYEKKTVINKKTITLDSGWDQGFCPSQAV